MKKSINLYYCEKPTKEKLEEIKKVGFDEVYIGIDAKTNDMSFEDSCKMAKSLGLNCTMVHCLYYEPNIHYFWEDGEIGDAVCDDYCEQIKRARNFTNNFVVHLNANKNQQQSHIGLQRIKRMLDLCDEYNINLCIENLYSNSEIPYIFNAIKHPRLKICYDVGHRNFLTPDFELAKNYHQFIEVLHLHDNMGEFDEHLPCGYGNIDWEQFARDLQLFPNVVLSAEVRSKDGENKFLEVVLNGLKLIENFYNKK